MIYPTFKLYYLDGRDEREVYFFTIEAAAKTLAHLHTIGMKVSLYFKGSIKI